MTYEALFARRTLGIRPGLAAVRSAFEMLREPAGAVPAIHVVGTNGKGSIAAMAEHALRRQGLRTGLFTSPHLLRVTERVRIDGVEVDDTVLEAAIASVLSIEGEPVPRALSFFEVLTLAAMVVFDQAGVDVVVAEAGLGGRLDSTRIVDARAVCMGAVDLDHQAYLGDTLIEIAAEKAAVFAERVPVFSTPQHPQVRSVLEAAASSVMCPLRWPEPIEAPLPGQHQRHNAAVAVGAAQVIARGVVEGDVLGARWPGRLERRQEGAGEWVLDVAHNPAAMAVLGDLLRGLPPRETVVLLARSADKDGQAMTQALGQVGALWTLEDPALGLHAAYGAELVAGLDALEARARTHVQAGGRLVVCGSHRLVGAVIGRWLGPQPSDANAQFRLDPSDPR